MSKFFRDVILPIILLLVAWTLKMVLSPLLVVYGTIASVRRLNLLYFRQVAVALDVLGNVMGGDIFNDCLRKLGGYDFGNRNDTISYALAMNRNMGTLTKFGKMIANVLEYLDPGHLQKAIDFRE